MLFKIDKTFYLPKSTTDKVFAIKIIELVNSLSLFSKCRIKMFKQFLAVLFVAGLAQATAQPKDLICDICIDVVTDLDEWLTSDATEGEIVHFMEGVNSSFRSELEL